MLYVQTVHSSLV